MGFFWKLQISKWFPIWNNCVPTGFTVKMTKLQLPSFHKRRNNFFNHVVYPYGNVFDSTSGNNKESKHNCFHIAPYMEIARIFYGTIPFLLSSLSE